VILFLITGQMPPILLLALLILCYLAVWDLRDEELPFLVKAWWILLVFITNVLGYAALRIWLAVRHRRQRV
jgi:hypothetical protein